MVVDREIVRDRVGSLRRSHLGEAVELERPHRVPSMVPPDHIPRPHREKQGVGIEIELLVVVAARVQRVVAAHQRPPLGQRGAQRLVVIGETIGRYRAGRADAHGVRRRRNLRTHPRRQGRHDLGKPGPRRPGEWDLFVLGDLAAEHRERQCFIGCQLHRRQEAVRLDLIPTGRTVERDGETGAFQFLEVAVDRPFCHFAGFGQIARRIGHARFDQREHLQQPVDPPIPRGCVWRRLIGVEPLVHASLLVSSLRPCGGTGPHGIPDHTRVWRVRPASD